MPSNTATYNFYLPTVGGDTNSWGGYLNSNWQDVEDLLDGTSSVAGIDINSGTIDNTPIGATTPSTGAFTTLSSTGTTTIGGASVTSTLIGQWNTAYGWGDHSTQGYLDNSDFTADSQILVGTGSGTFAAESGATLRTSIGVGTSDNVTFALVTGTAFRDTVYAVTGTTPAIAMSNGGIQTWTLSGNSTPTDSLSAGDMIVLMIDDGTAYTITWTSLVDQWIGGSALTLATTGYSVVVIWKVSTTVYASYVGDLS